MAKITDERLDEILKLLLKSKKDKKKRKAKKAKAKKAKKSKKIMFEDPFKPKPFMPLMSKFLGGGGGGFGNIPYSNAPLATTKIEVKEPSTQDDKLKKEQDNYFKTQLDEISKTNQKVAEVTKLTRDVSDKVDELDRKNFMNQQLMMSNIQYMNRPRNINVNRRDGLGVVASSSGFDELVNLQQDFSDIDQGSNFADAGDFADDEASKTGTDYKVDDDDEDNGDDEDDGDDDDAKSSATIQEVEDAEIIFEDDDGNQEEPILGEIIRPLPTETKKEKKERERKAKEILKKANEETLKKANEELKRQKEETNKKYKVTNFKSDGNDDRYAVLREDIENFKKNKIMPPRRFKLLNYKSKNDFEVGEEDVEYAKRPK